MTKETKRRPKPVFFRALGSNIFTILIITVLLTAAGLVVNAFLNGLAKVDEAASAPQTNNVIWVISIITVALVACLFFLQKIAPVDVFLSRKFCFLDVALIAFFLSSFSYSFLIDVSSQSSPFYKGCWATIPAIVAGLMAVLLLGIRWSILKLKAPTQTKITLADLLKTERIEDKDIKAIAICDSPSDDDLLDRGITKNRLACAIETSCHVPNWAIGVTGKWGHGKTTVINQVLDELDKKRYLVVNNFNVWSYQDQKSMLAGMLHCIREGLGMRSNARDAQREVLSFVDSVCSALNVNTKFATIFDRPSDNAAFLERMRDALANTKKRMVFVIDDLDRCPQTLMGFVFTTVASILNIDNITFLMAYDKDLVDEIVNADKKKYYTKKIVHVEIPIAPPDGGRIAELCLKICEKIGLKLDENEADCLKELFKDIKDLRELTRLLNAFFMDLSINRDQSKNEVYLYKRDMLVASYIKMFDPGLEEELRNARALLSKTSYSNEEYMKRLNIAKWAKVLVEQKNPAKELAEKRMSSPVFFDCYFADSYAGIPMAVNSINETIKNGGRVGEVIDKYYRESDARTILNALLFSKDVWTEKTTEEVAKKFLPYLKKMPDDGYEPPETSAFALAFEKMSEDKQQKLLKNGFKKEDLWMLNKLRQSYLEKESTKELFKERIEELFKQTINAKKYDPFNKNNFSYDNACALLHIGYQKRNKEKMEAFIQRRVNAHPENVMRIIGSAISIFPEYGEGKTTFMVSNDQDFNVISCFGNATKEAITNALQKRRPAKEGLEKTLLDVLGACEANHDLEYFPLEKRPTNDDWRSL